MTKAVPWIAGILGLVFLALAARLLAHTGGRLAELPPRI